MAKEIVYRFVERCDEARVKQLWQYCFTDDERFVQWYFQEYYRPENTIGAYQEGYLMGSLQMIPYQLWLRNQQVSVGYIVGVETAPEARRSGIGGRMLFAGLEAMKQRGQVIALLMPFEGSFYYPYQWQFCYFHHKYHVALSELALLRDNYGEMVPVDGKENWQVLNTLYSMFVKGKNGYIIRDEENWAHLFDDLALDKGYCYLLYHDDQPEGYLLYYFKGDHMVIKEMAYNHFSARKGLLNFVYSHRSHMATVQWSAPSDDGAEFIFSKTKTGAVLYPFLMARIVDLQGLMNQLTINNSEDRVWTMAVQDPLLPWNEGVFEFQIKNGRIFIEPRTHGNACDFAIAIDSLSQLVMGIVDANRLAYQESVVIYNEQKYRQWGELWPKMNNYIQECY